MKLIIFSLVFISLTCSVLNVVRGFKKYFREFSQTKRVFFALTFNIIFLGIFGTLTFGCVYTIAVFFIRDIENPKFKSNSTEKDEEERELRILNLICFSFQLAVAISIMLMAFARYILIIKSVEFHRFVTTKKWLFGGLQ